MEQSIDILFVVRAGNTNTAKTNVVSDVVIRIM